MPSAERQAVMAALRHIKEEVLFAFGADGDDCIQALVSAEGALPDRQIEIFGAFHAGMCAQAACDDDIAPTPMLSHAALRLAHETGARAVRLNLQRRRDSGMNVGPLDTPKAQMLLAKARAALGR